MKDEARVEAIGMFPAQVPGKLDNPFVSEEIRVRRELQAANRTIAALKMDVQRADNDREKLMGLLRRAHDQFWRLEHIHTRTEHILSFWESEAERLSAELDKQNGQRYRAYAILALVSISSLIYLAANLLIK